MKLNNILNESIDYEIPASIIKKCIESKFFKNNYQEFFDNLYTNTSNKAIEKKLSFIEMSIDSYVCNMNFLYKGSHYLRKYDEDNAVILNFEERENPLHTNYLLHKILNQLSQKKFNVNVRNLSFVVKNNTNAEGYGPLNIVFPLGNYELFYNPRVLDFTMAYNHVIATPRSVINDIITTITDSIIKKFGIEAIRENLVKEYDGIIDINTIKQMDFYRFFKSRVYEFNFEIGSSVDNMEKYKEKLMSIFKQYFFDKLLNDDINGVKNYLDNILNEKLDEVIRNIITKISQYVDKIVESKKIETIPVSSEIMLKCDQFIAINSRFRMQFLLKAYKMYIKSF